MARLKHSLISGTTLSQLVIVANEKGGQGKSLIALAVADHAYLHGARLGIAQVDAQYRLAHALGRNVLTIAPVEVSFTGRSPCGLARPEPCRPHWMTKSER